MRMLIITSDDYVLQRYIRIYIEEIIIVLSMIDVMYVPCGSLSTTTR